MKDFRRNMKGLGREAQHGRDGISSKCGQGILPKLWGSPGTESYRQTKKILFDCLQERMALEPSECEKLEVNQNGHLPCVFEIIPGKPGVWQGKKVLQPCLCKPRT